MDKKPLILLLFLLLNSVVAQGFESSSSSATTLLGKFRRMVGIDTTKDGINPTNATQISPSPSPISVAGSDLGVPVDSNLPPAKLPPLRPPTVTPPNHLNPSGSQIKEDSNQQGTTTDNCEASSNKCRDQTMIACLQHPKQKQMGIQEFILLVQNEGESSLKVNIIIPASVEIDLKELQIPKHQVKKINVVVKAGESPKIVLNAGYGDCVLQAGTPIFQRNIFPQIPSYTTLLTPVYGAYFVFLIALIVGGIWACCKFRKRGRQQGSSGIPYQELEMGMTGSSGSAINVDTADGWDQSWDDDWDEDRAVVSPAGGQHVGNMSANGLTARSSNKDGWDNDWDE